MLQIYLKVFLKLQVITRKQLTMVYLKAVHLMGSQFQKLALQQETLLVMSDGNDAGRNARTIYSYPL